MKRLNLLYVSRPMRLAIFIVLAIGLGDLALQAQQSSRLPVIGQGIAAISGTVTDAASGRPLAGALVTITPASGNGTGLAARQITDETGRFLFSDLEEGDGYNLGATRLGYTTGEFRRGAVGSSPTRIALAPGEWFANATIALQRLGAINGTVADEAGDPVVGAYVRVMTEILVAGQPHIVAGPVARTDDRGIYRLAGLAPGRYYVSVPSVQMSVPAATSLLTLSGTTAEAFASAEAAGRPTPLRRDPAIPVDGQNHLLVGSFATPPFSRADARARAYRPLYYPAARSSAEAVPIDLTYGEERHGIDLRLTPEPAVRITGRVEGPAEAVADLTLRLMAAGDESLGLSSETASALVAPDGTFTFLNVPAGRYVVDASRTVSEYGSLSMPMGSTNLPTPPAGFSTAAFPRLAPSAMPGALITSRGASPPGTAHFGRARVDVGAVDVSGIVVLLSRGVTMRGTVVAERTQTPPAAARPRVSLEPAGGEIMLGTLNEVGVDQFLEAMEKRAVPQGSIPANDSTSFTIEGLRQGEYLVRASAAIKSVTWEGKDYTHKPFDAAAGHDFDRVVVTTTDQVSQLSGAVRDSSGALPTRAAVICFPADPERWRRYGFQPMGLRSVAVTTAGNFNLERLPAGDYFLIAVDGEHGAKWRDPQFLERVAPQATRISIGWGEIGKQDLVLQHVR